MQAAEVASGMAVFHGQTGHQGESQQQVFAGNVPGISGLRTSPIWFCSGLLFANNSVLIGMLHNEWHAGTCCTSSFFSWLPKIVDL
jgi:hypothetical protein